MGVCKVNCALQRKTQPKIIAGFAYFIQALKWIGLKVWDDLDWGEVINKLLLVSCRSRASANAY